MSFWDLLVAKVGTPYAVLILAYCAGVVYWVVDIMIDLGQRLRYQRSRRSIEAIHRQRDQERRGGAERRI